MNKLLSANFIRLWKNKVFWIELAAMFIWTVIILLSAYRAASVNPGYSYDIKDYFFQYTLIIGGFCAIFTSLFLGTDYSDGTIRNKIVIGHSRPAIYLSNVIVSAAAGLIITAVWILTMLTLGTALLGWFKSSPGIIPVYLLISVPMIITFASIFTLISMLNQNKAYAAVITLLFFLALLFLASYFNNRLHEPEMYSPIVISSDGMDLSEPTPNPDYVRGNVRKVFTFLVDFLPTGQGILMSGMKATHLVLMPFYSLFITITTTLTGIWFFRRKDLK